MSNIKVELFYADWCPHCENFLPEWNNVLVPIFQKEGIKFAKYEAEENPQKMIDENIEGYPTIKITKDETTIDYKGDRTAKAIMDCIKNGLKSDKIQNGKFD